MRVLMLVSKSGSPDGLHIEDFNAGNVYDLPDVMAHLFLHARIAVPARPEEQPTVKAREAKPVRPKETPERKPRKRKARR